jgi:hypothetical protein
MGKKKISIICSSCGSKNVMRDAWAEWDEDAQDWTLHSTLDQGYCEDCEGEAHLDEAPLAKEPAP